MRATGGRNADAARELRNLNAAGRIEVVDIDVDDDASVERGVDRARELVGTIDVLVNNAGIVSAGPIALAAESVRREFETNVFGGLRMLRAVLPGMERAGSGLVVHISSGLGRFILPTAGGYCGSKFAMEAIMEAAAYELHPLGVEVAIVQPGEYQTRFKANGRQNAADARSQWSAAEREQSNRYREHFTVLDAAMQDRPTPPAQQVADAIVQLVRTPRGERPLRVPLDPREAGQQGLMGINGALEQAQVQLLQGNGIGHWTSLSQ
ncbi:MAG: SDR family NAD(P)-dependent oxidoreductase [Planctomycetota bacterium]